MLLSADSLTIFFVKIYCYWTRSVGVIAKGSRGPVFLETQCIYTLFNLLFICCDVNLCSNWSTVRTWESLMRKSNGQNASPVVTTSVLPTRTMKMMIGNPQTKLTWYLPFSVSFANYYCRLFKYGNCQLLCGIWFFVAVASFCCFSELTKLANMRHLIHKGLFWDLN